MTSCKTRTNCSRKVRKIESGNLPSALGMSTQFEKSAIHNFLEEMEEKEEKEKKKEEKEKKENRRRRRKRRRGGKRRRRGEREGFK